MKYMYIKQEERKGKWVNGNKIYCKYCIVIHYVKCMRTTRYSGDSHCPGETELYLILSVI